MSVVSCKICLHVLFYLNSNISEVG